MGKRPMIRPARSVVNVAWRKENGAPRPGIHTWAGGKAVNGRPSASWPDG